VIAEGLDSHGNVAWVHVSYTKSKNRKQVLVMLKDKGKTKYLPFNETKGFISTNYLK
jgi:hypothetical protein